MKDNADIPAGKLDLEVSEEILRERKKDWRSPEPKFTQGWLARYTSLVTSANTGAILKSLKINTFEEE